MNVTIREAQMWASSFLQQSGMTKDEALFTGERLLRHLLQWERAHFFAHREEPLSPALYEQFRQLVILRRAGVPLQHLVGYQEFYGRRFEVSPEVLIPRPETEGLIEAVLQETDAMWGMRPLTVVDVGTGSGAIAVTLAAERPEWKVYAVDISPPALQVARRNAARSGVGDRVHFLKGDMLTPFVERGEQVDIVVSNPPYIPLADMAQLAVEVREHEPTLALAGGEDGLAAYRVLATMLPDVVRREQGLVAVEVGAGQSPAVADILTGALPRGEVRIACDLAGIERVVLVRWS